MATVIGRAVGRPSERQVLLAEALQDALNNAPPPPEGSDIITLKLIDVQIQHGGFVLSTTTQVTLEVAEP